MKFLKKFFLFSILFLILVPFSNSLASSESDVYKAEVIEIINEETKFNEDGSSFVQQDLLLKIIDNDKKGEKVVYNGVSDIQVSNIDYYNKGDKVYLESYIDMDNNEVFYVSGIIRSQSLLWLTVLFFIAVLIVGRLKGFKALISLVLSFFVIIKFIIPAILNGYNPFFVSLFGSLAILALIIYITEGFKKKSHIAMLSILTTLFITLVLSIIFIHLSRLTGLAQEETIFLINNGTVALNFTGLLLAGFIIGSIGALDDIVVGQIESVEQIREANPKLNKKQVFKMSYKIGNTHLGAMINTLFLTYTGAALPLLMLFVINQKSGIGIENFVNLEVVSTEIVRTLVGSIGLIASMPIATFMASYFLKKEID